MAKEKFLYVTYIRSTKEKVWDALINPQVTELYWRHHNVSDWKPGSDWNHQRCDGSKAIDITGKVIETSPPNRLVISWADPSDTSQLSRVTFEIEPLDGEVKLTVTHDELEPGSNMLRGISRGWPMVLSSLKTLLETGKAIDVSKLKS